MKPKPAHARKPAVITNSRWLAYATAGAASAFTGTHSVEATIHYSGRIGLFLGLVHDRSVHFQLDQPGDSFFLQHSDDFSGTNHYSGFARFGIVGLAGASFAGFFNTHTYYSSCGSNLVPFVSRLHRSEPVSRRPFSAANLGFMAGNGSPCELSFGPWLGVVHGFIGFKFNNGNGNQYGWVRISMLGDPFHPFRLVDYAYADPGEPILAGQKSSNEMVPEESNDVIPQEGSLGWLALGAAGLLAWRKRRSQAHVE
jgi:hypothetical protein